MEDRARILEDQVEGLAREIARTINEARIDGRPGIRGDLKDFAVSLIQDSVAPPQASTADAIATRDVRFNPLAMGIPLFFAGAVLVFLFPPVGMMLFAASLVMLAAGLLMSLFGRR